jgi:branched-chain amino acid transport system substrate-binding protein
MRRHQKAMFLAALFLTVTLIGGLTASAQNKRVVKITFIGPLTGGAAAFGLGGRNCVDLAIREANKSGKFPYELKLLALDDASDPDTGVAAAERACSDPEVVAGIGHFNSPVALATIHVFHRYGVPFIVWFAVHPDITYGHKYKEIFRVYQIMSVQMDAIANALVKEFKYNKWCLIHDMSSLGEIQRKDFMNSFSKEGAQILSVDGVSVGQTDFLPVLTKVKALNPEGIYYGGVVMEAALIKAQMKKLGMNNVVFASGSGIVTDTFNEIAKDAAEGTMGFFMGKPVEKLKGGQDFLAAYKAAGYKEPYEVAGPLAYDAAGIILAALQKVGPDDKEALAKAISSIKYDGLLGETTFDEHGQTRLTPISEFVSQDGKWVIYGDSLYAKGLRKLPRR